MKTKIFVLLAVLITPPLFYFMGMHAGFGKSADYAGRHFEEGYNLAKKQQQWEKEYGFIRAILYRQDSLKTATRTPAFGFCDRMPADDTWTCEVDPIPDATFSTVKAEYEKQK